MSRATHKRSERAAMDRPATSEPAAAGPDPVRAHARGCELDVLVAPRAARSQVVGVHDGRLKIQLAAPPVDGAANSALCELLSARLDLPRTALEIARGATGRRKTVRISGLDPAAVRARLGLAALLGPALVLPVLLWQALVSPPLDPPARRGPDLADAPLAQLWRLAPLVLLLALAGLGACTTELPFPVRVVLPDDAADLNRADNLGLELGPDGYFVNYPVRGAEFELELEFEPDAVERTLALYLADGTELLAHGRSVPFVLLRPPGDLAVLMARPGVLSVYPGEVAEPDPDLRAVYYPGRGLALFSAAGDLALLNETNYDIELGARLAGAPQPADGAFVADARGRLWRAGGDEGLRAAMYDPAGDRWAVATIVGGDDGVGDDGAARPGALWALGAARDRLYIAGGGSRSDLVALSLEPDDDGHVQLARVGDLDVPRAGARLLALPRGDDEVVIVIGGEADVPALQFPVGGHEVGPVGAWTNIQCIALDLAEAATDSLRVLCLGGLRSGQPTGDALLITCPAAVEGTVVEELPAFLSAPLEDPRLFADDLAVYAQGATQWWRVDREGLTVELTDTVATRVHGGHSITVGTGVTFLVGGRDLDDRAVDRWWIFAPSLAPK